jgi:hypothetical protein
MARCETCGNENDKTFEINISGASHTFDSFECAIQTLAPTHTYGLKLLRVVDDRPQALADQRVGR